MVDILIDGGTILTMDGKRRLVTGGAVSNNSQDMMKTLKATALLQKVSIRDPLSITVEQVLEMVTINGAKAVGLEEKIGSLEQGKLADITIINLKSPSIVPVNRLASKIVYCAKIGDVETVIINGKTLCEKEG